MNMSVFTCLVLKTCVLLDFVMCAWTGRRASKYHGYYLLCSTFYFHFIVLFRLFMGKNSVAQIAFGRTPEEEYKDNMRHVAKLLEGDVGILFTSRKHKEVVKYFKNFKSEEFALAGSLPRETVVIPPGELSFPVSMLDELRRLGMIVEVQDGKLMLRESVTAAQEGVALTPEQAKILVKFDRRIVTFTIDLLCKWENGKFEEL